MRVKSISRGEVSQRPPPTLREMAPLYTFTTRGDLHVGSVRWRIEGSVGDSLGRSSKSPAAAIATEADMTRLVTLVAL